MSPVPHTPRPEGSDTPDPVQRVLGADAIHCDLCGAWHHRLFHARVRPLVYIAGPYSHPDPIVNTRNAVQCADVLDEYFHCAPVVPHLSLAWHLIAPQPIEVWYRRDLAVLTYCHALVRLSGESTGADREVDYAHRLSIPVFHVPDDIGSGAFLGWRRVWSPPPTIVAAVTTTEETT